MTSGLVAVSALVVSALVGAFGGFLSARWLENRRKDRNRKAGLADPRVGSLDDLDDLNDLNDLDDSARPVAVDAPAPPAIRTAFVDPPSPSAFPVPVADVPDSVLASLSDAEIDALPADLPRLVRPRQRRAPPPRARPLNRL